MKESLALYNILAILVLLSLPALAQNSPRVDDDSNEGKEDYARLEILYSFNRAEFDQYVDQVRRTTHAPEVTMQFAPFAGNINANDNVLVQNLKRTAAFVGLSKVLNGPRKDPTYQGNYPDYVVKFTDTTVTVGVTVPVFKSEAVQIFTGMSGGFYSVYEGDSEQITPRSDYRNEFGSNVLVGTRLRLNGPVYFVFNAERSVSGSTPRIGIKAGVSIAFK